MDKDKLLKRYKNLPHFKGLSDEEIMKKIDAKQLEEELANEFVGLSSDEKKKAILLYDKYVTENSFESLAEKTTLATLVYLEILTERIKLFIEQEGNDKNGAIPLKQVEQLGFTTQQITQLKEKLGMLKDSESDTALNLFNELKAKATKYYDEHAGETYVKCPYCTQLFRLLMKVDNLEPAQATFFRKTTLYNVKLMELYHHKKLTIEEMAEIFGVHAKYITFIYENIYLRDLNDKKD